MHKSNYGNFKWQSKLTCTYARTRAHAHSLSLSLSLSVYCLSCLNINRVCKGGFSPSIFHLISSLARTSCQKGLKVLMNLNYNPWKIKFSSLSSLSLCSWPVSPSAGQRPRVSSHPPYAPFSAAAPSGQKSQPPKQPEVSVQYSFADTMGQLVRGGQIPMGPLPPPAPHPHPPSPPNTWLAVTISERHFSSFRSSQDPDLCFVSFLACSTFLNGLNVSGNVSM